MVGAPSFPTLGRAYNGVRMTELNPFHTKHQAYDNDADTIPRPLHAVLKMTAMMLYITVFLNAHTANRMLLIKAQT